MAVRQYGCTAVRLYGCGSAYTLGLRSTEPYVTERRRLWWCLNSSWMFDVSRKSKSSLMAQEDGQSLMTPGTIQLSLMRVTRKLTFCGSGPVGSSSVFLHSALSSVLVVTVASCSLNAVQKDLAPLTLHSRSTHAPLTLTDSAEVRLTCFDFSKPQLSPLQESYYKPQSVKRRFRSEEATSHLIRNGSYNCMSLLILLYRDNVKEFINNSWYDVLRPQTSLRWFSAIEDNVWSTITILTDD